MKRVSSLVAVAVLAMSTTAIATNAFRGIPDGQAANPWFQQAQDATETAQSSRADRNPPKNVILFVGDGMGVSTVTAARILEGQLRGESGEANLLSFEEFENVALSKTYNVDAQVPDSAGTMTAMMTGVKTDIGVLNLDESVERGVCGSGEALTSWVELAEQNGLSTGVVSTARITHATPAATYAVSADRNWEADVDVPEGCDQPDIASQLLAFDGGDGIDVVLGGGRRAFLPVDTPTVEGPDGVREDGRNLAEEWTDIYPASAYVETKSDLDALDLSGVDHLLGLFESSHVEYEYDRTATGDDEPSLEKMTEAAIEVLDDNGRGYALMVEAGRIDHAHHATNAYRALTDTIEMAEAVQRATELVDLRETMIVVTADHSHVFTIAGYPERGNDILGIAGDDAHDEGYTTLGYANGSSSGFAHDHDEDGNIDPDDAPYYEDGLGRLNVTEPTDPEYQQQALVELGSETHAGEDVPIYSTGPGSRLFNGVKEQNFIGAAIIDLLKLDR